jgi:hypothetical protein
MKKDTVILLGVIAAGLYIMFDTKAVKRHWYLPAKFDAKLNISNMVSSGRETSQVGEVQMLAIERGETDPVSLITALISMTV